MASTAVFASAVKSASVIAAEGSALRLKSSCAKRSLITVKASTGTVAKVVASSAVRLVGPCHLSAAAFSLRNMDVFSSVEAGMAATASFTAARKSS